jgi:ethanolamine ammonia-lyase small subunit
MTDLAHPSIESTAALRRAARELTPARIGLGRTGVSLETRYLLDFQQAHALARDAVHARLDPASLAASLTAIVGNQVLRMRSAAPDRTTYLQRPDLGRVLSEAGRESLIRHSPESGFDLALIVVDGLSALAVERHAAPLITELLPHLDSWSLAPLCVVEQGRVAIGDEIGAAFQASAAVVLIGERPGLSSPDSLGAYITWSPRPGRTDAERNCVSNIRSEGLTYPLAAAQIAAILAEARRCRVTGVTLMSAAKLIGRG